MANGSDILQGRLPDDGWSGWASLLMALGALALAAGGVVASINADRSGDLVLGLIAAAVGVLWLANVPTSR